MKDSEVTGIAELIRRLRHEKIMGLCIDMHPYDADHDAEVVRLRSLPHVRHAMNLFAPTSAESQATWRRGYESRSNDIMWMIREKSGRVCGTNRLYEITADQAEKGSLIIDPMVSRGVPAALESEVRLIDAAFGVFRLRRLVTHVRDDNAAMRGINSRFGFAPVSEVDIRGVRFTKSVLEREAWNSKPWWDVLAHHARRYSAVKEQSAHDVSGKVSDERES